MKRTTAILTVFAAALTVLPLTSMADEAAALKTLSGSDLHARAMACDKLGRVGTAKAVPALAKLLADEQLHDYARDALERIPDPAAGKALVDGLGSLKGDLRIGVIVSLGDRGETSAVSALAKIANKPGVAGDSALSSLAKIASDDASDAILNALAKGDDAVKLSAAHAALSAAQRLDKAGNGKSAKKLRAAVAKADVPAHLKAAAK